MKLLTAILSKKQLKRARKLSFGDRYKLAQFIHADKDGKRLLGGN